MKIPSFVFFLVYATVSSHTTAQSIGALTRVNRYECTERQIFQPTRNAPPQDCARAVLEGFYMDSNVGLFHRGGPPDRFQVPRRSVAGECAVSLNTATEGSVEGRWFDIWTVAQTLNTACTYYRTSEPSSAVTGGHIEVYGSNGLVLIMRRIPLGSNSTVSTD